MSNTMSTKQALAKLNSGLQRVNDGQKHLTDLLFNEFTGGMLEIYEVKEWLEDFIERVGDVKPGG